MLIFPESSFTSTLGPLELSNLMLQVNIDIVTSSAVSLLPSGRYMTSWAANLLTVKPAYPRLHVQMRNL